MKIARKEQLERLSTFFSLLIEGVELEEISFKMGLSPSQIVELKNKLIDLKTEEVRNKPVEHVYVEYMLEQMKNMYDLTKLIKKYDGDHRSMSAVVGAIRVRSEISDKILQRGQDCGLIKKTPQQSENKHAILIAGLNSLELADKIKEQWRSLANLVSKESNENIIDLPVPENLHYGETSKFLEEKDEDEDDEDEIYIKPKKKKKKKKKKKRKVE